MFRNKGLRLEERPGNIDTAVNNGFIKNPMTHPRDSTAETNDSTNPKTKFKLAVCHTGDVVHILGMDIIRFLQLYIKINPLASSGNQTKTQW